MRLASPRGFCAGVERAVRTVEDALALFGAPVFVRHEIVHNAHVVRRLRVMGAVFVETLSDVIPGRPVIFSAHGAPRTAYDDARDRSLLTIDATCPLVLKVHNEVRRHVVQGKHVILIGHRGHPEVVGTMGQAPEGSVTLVETTQDAETVAVSVLVPLPTATADHQTHNARTLAAAGAAVHLPERALSGDVLARQVIDLLGRPEQLATTASAARSRGRPNAAREIVSRILTLLP